jgi:hypothetical protein
MEIFMTDGAPNVPPNVELNDMGVGSIADVGVKPVYFHSIAPSVG